MPPAGHELVPAHADHQLAVTLLKSQLRAVGPWRGGQGLPGLHPPDRPPGRAPGGVGGCVTVKLSASPATSATRWSPGAASPLKTFIASGSWRCFCIARLSGLAP